MALRRWIIEKLGGTLKAPALPTGPTARRQDMPEALGLALQKLAVKDPQLARAAAEEVVQRAAAAEALARAAAKPRSVWARARLALGTAVLAGLAHVIPGVGEVPTLTVQEALGGSLLGDRGTLTQNEDIGFRPISERAYGKRTRDLTILSHREMVNVALWLYSSNALAEWLVDTPVALVLGEEIGYTPAINTGLAKDDPNAPEEAKTADGAAKLMARIRTALDKFWYHPAHNIAERAPEYARTFLVTGHLVLPVTFVNATDGCPQIDLVDAFQITGVNPRNGSAIVPGLVRFTPMDAGAISATEQAYAVLQQDVEGYLRPKPPVTKDSDARTPGVMELADLDVPDGIRVIGQALYFRNNKLLNSMRGISYLMPIADWLDALDSFTWAMLDRARLRNNIVWYLKFTGSGSDENLKSEVDKLLGVLQSRNGSVYASNKQIDLTALNAQLGASDSVEIGQMILTHILGSKGFPESWYSKGSGTNRATAGEQTDVAYKTLAALQARLRGIFRTLLHMAYDSMQAKQPAVLPDRVKSPWLTIEPNMPMLKERDMSRLAAAVAQLVPSLETAIASKLLSTETARRITLDVLGQVTAGAYEADEEAQKIDEEEDQAAQADAGAAASRAKAALEDPLNAIDAGGKVPPPQPVQVDTVPV